uniref:Uncharacterized protein n=1 Tax=Molossus molossus TaxID=27622 RepID=A0A7J8JXB1_MOLMO|nr:hypothetical protein HJG59_008121 [Molossus molossus]
MLSSRGSETAAGWSSSCFLRVLEESGLLVAAGRGGVQGFPQVDRPEEGLPPRTVGQSCSEAAGEGALWRPTLNYSQRPSESVAGTPAAWRSRERLAGCHHSPGRANPPHSTCWPLSHPQNLLHPRPMLENQRHTWS